MGQREEYEDFESWKMVHNTAAHYRQSRRQASRWIQEDSCPEYLKKCEECLINENKRSSQPLHLISEPELLEVAQHELLVVFAKQLLENEHSGCCAMLRDGKKGDLSRMYRLYLPIQRGLKLIADLLKQQITAEGNALIKQADDAATKRVLIREVIELHDKDMVYVTDCFRNHILFHAALKEAFEIFCNKTVAGSSTAELLATFCHNILKKGGSDEATEGILENVVKLLVYTSDKDLFVKFYQVDLAHRLLFDLRGNYDHEIAMLRKLREKSGILSSKMVRLIMDMTVTEESKSEFRQCLRKPGAWIDCHCSYLWSLAKFQKI